MVYEKKYIATVSGYSAHIPNYSSFKSKDILGVIVEVGKLVKSSSNIKNKFESTYLDKHMGAILSCGIPYGFYFDSNVLSSNDVKEEVYEFSFILRKYPSKLGVWVHSDFSNSIPNNDMILNEYHKRFMLLGLKDQIGIYCKRDALRRISWSSHKDKWWLWLVDQFKSDSQFSDPIDYSIFQS